MSTVKKHVRKGKNKVSVVKQHTRKGLVRLMPVKGLHENISKKGLLENAQFTLSGEGHKIPKRSRGDFKTKLKQSKNFFNRSKKSA